MAAPEQLPLESPHWMRIETAYLAYEKQTGDEALALFDLGKAVHEGRLRAKFRALLGEHRLLTRTDVAGVKLVRWNDAIGWERLPQDARVFIWKPDLLEILASVEPPQTEAAPAEPGKPRSRRGRQPKYDWPSICAEIARRCHDKSGRVQVPTNESRLADDVAEWCEQRFGPGNEPGNTMLRAAVKKVCAALRTVAKK